VLDKKSNYEENLYNKRRRIYSGMDTRMKSQHSIEMMFFGDGLLKKRKCSRKWRVCDVEFYNVYMYTL